MEIKWIKLSDRKPTAKERSRNWKFLVCNKNDDWVDSAYYEKGTWNNGECGVIPTHWAELPDLPND